jgi:hypothetical protein
MKGKMLSRVGAGMAFKMKITVAICLFAHAWLCMYVEEKFRLSH